MSLLTPIWWEETYKTGVTTGPVFKNLGFLTFYRLSCRLGMQKIMTERESGRYIYIHHGNYEEVVIKYMGREIANHG